MSRPSRMTALEKFFGIFGTVKPFRDLGCGDAF